MGLPSTPQAASRCRTRYTPGSMGWRGSEHISFQAAPATNCDYGGTRLARDRPSPQTPRVLVAPTAASRFPTHNPRTDLAPSPTRRRAGFSLAPAQTPGEAGKADIAAGEPRLAPCTGAAMLLAVVFGNWHFPSPRHCSIQREGRDHPRAVEWGREDPRVPQHPPGRFDLTASAPSPKPLPDLAAGVWVRPLWGWGWAQAGAGMRWSRVFGLRREGDTPHFCCLQNAGVRRGRKPFGACQSPAKSFPPALPAQIAIPGTCSPCAASFPGTKPVSSGRPNE